MNSNITSIEIHSHNGSRRSSSGNNEVETSTDMNKIDTVAGVGKGDVHNAGEGSKGCLYKCCKFIDIIIL